MGAGVLVVLVIILGIVMMTRPSYKTVFSENLAAKEIAEVASVLSENSINYKLINNSTNIQVEEKDYEEALMYTALSDLPSSGLKFEDIINNSMSTTTSEVTLKSNEYKKQQLENTLILMNGVEKARVELVIPEQKNSYMQSQVQSSASVFLTLSEPLTSKQCEGIATYLAASVSNLDKTNVVVIDSQGNTLYSGQEEEQFNLEKQQEMKGAAEKELTQKVTNLFGNLYDDIRISPNLILNFDEYQEVSERYNTQGDDDSRGVIQQEYQASSSTTTGNSGAEPGVTTNGGEIATYQTGDGKTGESKENESEIVYAPDKTQTNYIKNVGDVDLDRSSLSINLFKNRIYREEDITPTLTGMTWSEYKQENSQPRALAVDESIISSVQNATGISNVVVNAYENPIFLDQAIYQIDYKSYLPFILLVLVIILIAIFLLRFRKHEETVELEPELEVESMLKVAKEQVELEEIEVKETLETKRQIDKFVDEKPEAVASLLRNWLTEEDWD